MGDRVVRGRHSERKPVVFASTGEDRTKQSFKDTTDINHIMGRYLRSGNIDWSAKHAGSYGEIEPQTFHEAMNVVARAKEMFADLPAPVRKRFGNEPAAFLEFFNNSDNIDEMRKLGLAEPEKEEVLVPPARVVVVEDETRYGDAGEVPAPASGSRARAPAGGEGVAPPRRRSPPTQSST